MKLIRYILLGILASLSFAGSTSANAPAWFDELVEEAAPGRSIEAIKQINGVDRKMLALRSYLRAGSSLDERWSWTKVEIDAFQGSPEQTALLAEVAAISEHFAARNPGYELHANTKVRSLDVQIARWNENVSVGSAAMELFASLSDEFPDVESKGQISPEKLESWLRSYSSEQRASLAAPGLTRHGQGHAIDFQIMQDGKFVAPADTSLVATVWEANGWADKLAESIAAAGPSFYGPLTSPNEPWHYDYRPENKKR